MYHLIRQKRKSVTIEVTDDLEIIVKVPYHVSQAEVDQLIMKNKSWIETMKKKKQQKQIEKEWLITKKYTYLGEKLHVEVIESEKCQVCIDQDSLKIYTPNPEDYFLIKKQVEEYTKKQILDLFTKLTKEYSILLKCNYKHITVRNQKTRWGSCSKDGNLSYNIRLRSAPIEVIEYVVLHEVAHLIHFDHSKAFWETIKAMMPDYKERRQYLKDQGSTFQ